MDDSQLYFAQKLIKETNLSLSDVMLACNFNSAQDFNESYKNCFACYPHDTQRQPLSIHSVVLSVPYLKPYDFNWILKSYKNHKIGNLEWFEEDKMFRLITWNDTVGSISIANDAPKSQLLLEINFADVRYYPTLFERVKSMFDVECNPALLNDFFKKDQTIWELFKKNPGIRIATGWDPFEISIGTILGQLVSVERGQSLLYDLIELLGEPTSFTYENKIIKQFPSAKAIANADLSSLKTTKIRKKTLLEFSKAYLNEEVHFDAKLSIEDFKKNLLKVYGIGPWTANYIALKAFRHKDAFPDSDLLLARAIKLFPEGVFDLMQPMRGYVAMLLWYEYASALSKVKADRSRISKA